jgi:hypothetical protein
MTDPVPDADERLLHLLGWEPCHPGAADGPWWRSPCGWYVFRQRFAVSLARAAVPGYDRGHGPIAAEDTP